MTGLELLLLSLGGLGALCAFSLIFDKKGASRGNYLDKQHRSANHSGYRGCEWHTKFWEARV